MLIGEMTGTPLNTDMPAGLRYKNIAAGLLLLLGHGRADHRFPPMNVAHIKTQNTTAVNQGRCRVETIILSWGVAKKEGEG
jgi:hypothetical protein